MLQRIDKCALPMPSLFSNNSIDLLIVFTAGHFSSLIYGSGYTMLGWFRLFLVLLSKVDRFIEKDKMLGLQLDFFRLS